MVKNIIVKFCKVFIGVILSLNFFVPLATYFQVPKAEADSTVLSQGDITYDNCYYNVNHGLDTDYDMGLAFRYVNGDLRFLQYGISTAPQPASFGVFEYSLASLNCGDTVTNESNRWNYPWDPTSSVGHGNMGSECANLTIDPSNPTLLWTTEGTNCTAYGQGSVQPVQTTTRTLNSNGTVSNVHGPVGLQGIPDRRAFGGVLFVPSSFQSQYNVPPYATGFGGYFSVVAQDGGASFGPAIYFFPSIAGYANNTEIPSGSFKIAADTYSPSSDSETDWYNGTGLTQPTTYDRGLRVSTDINNYFEGGDPRSNPSDCTTTVDTSGATVTVHDITTQPQCFQTWWQGFTVAGQPNVPAFHVTINGVNYTVASITSGSTLTLTTSAGTQASVSLVGPDTRPTFKPQTTAAWLSPAPDGYGRWTWGDQYSSASWITGSKQGVVMFYNGGQGDCWYHTSAGNCDGQEFEFHVFDPNTLAQSLAGTLPPWNIRPTNMWVQSFPGLIGTHSSPSNAWMVYDPSTSKLWVLARSIATHVNRLYRFSVNTTSTISPTVTLTASPTTITSGSPSTLTWSSTNATSCTASGAWSGSKSTSGTQSVSPSTTSTYTLICTGTGGSANASATVNTPTPLPGDINLDHIVNSIDWSIMNAHWFTNYAPADLNSDGIVNSIDFSILNANWFKTW